MRRTVISAFILLLTASAFAQETQRYFVGTRGPVTDDGMVRRLYRDADSQAQPRGVMTFKIVNAFAADLTADEVRALKASPQVTYIEPVQEMHAFATPLRNYNGQTVPAGIDAVKARDVWSAGRGTGTNVVVIDTGVDYKHPDLKGIYQGGDDYVNNDGDPMDDAGHGTHVSGTIAAADDNAGVVGIAPNVRLWAIKVLNSEGTGSNDKLIKGLDWVVAKKKELGGNWVVNLSLGHPGSSATERTAVNRSLDAGIIIVAASGNESTSASIAVVAYPAGYPNVLAIGAIDSTEKIASFSNQGPELDLVAPGVGVLSSVAEGFGSKTYVGQSSDLFYSVPVTGTPTGSISGQFVFCGFGASASDYPASVQGKIALVARGGNIAFAWKSRRAKEAGAIGVVIYNRPDADVNDLNWGMRPITTSPQPDDVWTADYQFLLTVGVTYEDGIALQAKAGSPAALTAVNEKDDYDVYSGTSMATPHVVGAAALIWSLAPNATASDVRNALMSTAKDLGNTGLDNTYGNGMVNVLAAAKLLAPSAFNPTVETHPQPTTGRVPGRRGH